MSTVYGLNIMKTHFMPPFRPDWKLIQQRDAKNILPVCRSNRKDVYGSPETIIKIKL